MLCVCKSAKMDIAGGGRVESNKCGGMQAVVSGGGKVVVEGYLHNRLQEHIVYSRAQAWSMPRTVPPAPTNRPVLQFYEWEGTMPTEIPTERNAAQQAWLKAENSSSSSRMKAREPYQSSLRRHVPAQPSMCHQNGTGGVGRGKREIWQVESGKQRGYGLSAVGREAVVAESCVPRQARCLGR